MSGHSKWSSIKHKKGAADAKRGKLFSKLSRAIIVAAREGGGDPAGNLALQNAIEKARSYSMPKDNIDRAIAKGAGTDADAAPTRRSSTRATAPSGVAVLVEALTDNRNRTAADVRHLFAKNDGNLGATGRGRVAVRAHAASCSSTPTASTRTSSCSRPPRAARRTSSSTARSSGSPPRRRSSRRVREAVEAAGFTVDSAELTMLPKTTVEVDDETTAKKIVRLMDALEENDDVQDVYANFDIPERVLETVAG